MNRQLLLCILLLLPLCLGAESIAPPTLRSSNSPDRSKTANDGLAPSALRTQEALAEQLARRQGELFPSALQSAQNATLPAPLTSRLMESLSWDKPEPTRLEALYRSRYGAEAAAGLQQFGYDLFLDREETPPPAADPGQDYVLGPGDRLRVRLWGSFDDLAAVSPIGPDGSVDLPRLGVINMDGLTMAQARELVSRQAERYLQGVQSNVSLDHMRSRPVYVVGAVKKPGLHMVPANATVLDALTAAGGVAPDGSLRRIALKRSGSLVAYVDLYDLILQGESGSDAVLRDRDVVFAPRIGPTAAAAGAVEHAAIYELNGEQTLQDLLQLAGGPLPQADAERAYIRRYDAAPAETGYAVRDFPLQNLQEVSIQDGDMLELSFRTPDWPTAVQVTGQVKQPSSHAFTDGLMLSQVLPSLDGLAPGAVTDFAWLQRYDPATAQRRVVTIPLLQALQGQFDMELAPYDVVEVLTREDFAMYEQVQLHGAVWLEGNFTYAPGMRLVDLLAMGGGFRFGAQTDRIEVSRKTFAGQNAGVDMLVLPYAANTGFPLEAYDYVFVPQAREAETFKIASIRGEVPFPGEYTLREGDHLSDLVQRAGGFTQEAYFYGASYTSEQARIIQQESIERAIDDLQKRAYRLLSEQAQTLADPNQAQVTQASRHAVEQLLSRLSQVKAQGRVSIKLANLDVFRGSAHDFLVHDGDALTIPRKPNFVSVMGSVYSPSAYLYEQQLTVKEYLDKSGGFTPDADSDRVYVLKANGEVESMARDGDDVLEARLMPGDTIVVPEDLEQVPYLRLVKDVTDILFKIATTAGVVVALL